jgi:hypothetical protein
VDTCYVYKTSPEWRLLGTVALVCLGPRKCLDVINNNTNLSCLVHFLHVITCCREIVTPSTVFINNFLSTPIAMLWNKWKDSYDSNHKCTRKLEETFVWVQRAADGSEAAYCKLCHCNILPRISNLSNHENQRNTSGELHYKARHDLM